MAHTKHASYDDGSWLRQNRPGRVRFGLAEATICLHAGKHGPAYANEQQSQSNPLQLERPSIAQPSAATLQEGKTARHVQQNHRGLCDMGERATASELFHRSVYLDWTRRGEATYLARRR